MRHKNTSQMDDRSTWVNLAVKPNFSWPNSLVQIPFENRKIVLQPRRDALACTVSLYDEEGLTIEEGGKIIYRFLSRLAWSMEGGIEELFICGSNNPERPGLLGQGTYSQSGWAQIKPWNYLYLPIPGSEKAERALAVFREAMSVNSTPYAFLGYFKVINIPFASGNDQMKWINENLKDIWYQPAVDRLNELTTAKPDIGEYLYHQGRCAVAHAFDNDIVNPDSYPDKRRIENDLPLMKEIAALCIEREYMIRTDSSFWSHLKQTDAETPELLKRKKNEDDWVAYEAEK